MRTRRSYCFGFSRRASRKSQVGLVSRGRSYRMLSRAEDRYLVMRTIALGKSLKLGCAASASARSLIFFAPIHQSGPKRRKCLASWRLGVSSASKRDRLQSPLQRSGPRPAAGGTRMWRWRRAFSLAEEGNLDAGSNWAERDAQRGASSPACLRPAIRAERQIIASGSDPADGGLAGRFVRFLTNQLRRLR